MTAIDVLSALWCLTVALSLLWCTPIGAWLAKVFGVDDDAPRWLQQLYLGPWNAE